MKTEGTTMDFKNRCKVAADRLPDSEYKMMLTTLLNEMLEEIERLRPATYRRVPVRTSTC